MLGAFYAPGPPSLASAFDWLTALIAGGLLFVLVVVGLVNERIEQRRRARQDRSRATTAKPRNRDRHTPEDVRHAA